MPQGQPFANPGPQFAGPGASPMGYHQPQSHAQAPGQSPHACHHAFVHNPEYYKHDTHQYGQLMRLVNDLANGNADPSRVMDFLGSLDPHFWKGVLVGVSGTLLLTNDTVKNAIVGAVSGIFGVFGKETKEEKPE
jgi:hypothetical protein